VLERRGELLEQFGQLGKLRLAMAERRRGLALEASQPIDHVHRYSRVHNTTAFGVLRLTLRSGAYDWRFRPAAGATFGDSGTARCHGAP